MGHGSGATGVLAQIREVHERALIRSRDSISDPRDLALLADHFPEEIAANPSAPLWVLVRLAYLFPEMVLDDPGFRLDVPEAEELFLDPPNRHFARGAAILVRHEHAGADLVRFARASRNLEVLAGLVERDDTTVEVIEGVWRFTKRRIALDRDRRLGTWHSSTYESILTALALHEKTSRLMRSELLKLGYAPAGIAIAERPDATARDVHEVYRAFHKEPRVAQVIASLPATSEELLVHLRHHGISREVREAAEEELSRRAAHRPT